MSALSGELATLATAYRLGYHDHHCRSGVDCPDREGCSWRWAAHVPASAFVSAVAHLRAHPRDARGARRILHDAVCMAGGDLCPRRDDHAARTWTVGVRVLRRVLRDHTLETTAPESPPCTTADG